MLAAGGGGGTMRRLLRWTFNTLAAASLLLCLATAGLLVRSYWAPDQLVAERTGARMGVAHYAFAAESDRGQFAASAFWITLPDADPTLRPLDVPAKWPYECPRLVEEWA